MNKWLTCPSCQWKLQKVCEKLSHINRQIMMVDIQPNHQERMVKKHTTSSISLIKGMGEMLHKAAQEPKTEGLFSGGGIPCLSLTYSLHTADISFDMVEYIVHVSIEWLTFCVKFYFQYINIQKSWLLFCPCLDFSAGPPNWSHPHHLFDVVALLWKLNWPVSPSALMTSVFALNLLQLSPKKGELSPTPAIVRLMGTGLALSVWHPPK